MAIIERKDKDGARYLLLDFRDQEGRRVRESLGPVSKTYARRELGKRKAAVAEGTYANPHQDKNKEKDAETWGKVADEFIRKYKGRRGQLRSSYYVGAMVSIAPFFQCRVFAETTPADIEEFREWRSKQKRKDGKIISSSTVQKEMGVLTTLYRWARKHGKIESDPTADVEKPLAAPPRARPLTVAQLDAVAAELAPDERNIALLALAVGQSLSDVTGLQWSDVDRPKGLIYFERNKSKQRFHIHISDATAAILGHFENRRKEVARLTGRLLPYVIISEAGQDYHGYSARKTLGVRFRRACKRAGMAEFSFKSLRTTAASWAEEEGVPIGYTSKMLGHADVRTTQHYYTRSEADLTRRPAEVISDRLGHLCGDTG